MERVRKNKYTSEEDFVNEVQEVISSSDNLELLLDIEVPNSLAQILQSDSNCMSTNSIVEVTVIAPSFSDSQHSTTQSLSTVPSQTVIESDNKLPESKRLAELISNRVGNVDDFEGDTCPKKIICTLDESIVREIESDHNRQNFNLEQENRNLKLNKSIQTLPNVFNQNNNENSHTATKTDGPTEKTEKSLRRKKSKLKPYHLELIQKSPNLDEQECAIIHNLVLEEIESFLSKKPKKRKAKKSAQVDKKCQVSVCRDIKALNFCDQIPEKDINVRLENGINYYGKKGDLCSMNGGNHFGENIGIQENVTFNNQNTRINDITLNVLKEYQQKRPNGIFTSAESMMNSLPIENDHLLSVNSLRGDYNTNKPYTCINQKPSKSNTIKTNIVSDIKRGKNSSISISSLQNITTDLETIENYELNLSKLNTIYDQLTKSDDQTSNNSSNFIWKATTRKKSISVQCSKNSLGKLSTDSSSTINRSDKPISDVSMQFDHAIEEKISNITTEHSKNSEKIFKLQIAASDNCPNINEHILEEIKHAVVKKINKLKKDNKLSIISDADTNESTRNQIAIEINLKRSRLINKNKEYGVNKKMSDGSMLLWDGLPVSGDFDLKRHVEQLVDTKVNQIRKGSSKEVVNKTPSNFSLGNELYFDVSTNSGIKLVETSLDPNSRSTLNVSDSKMEGNSKNYYMINIENSQNNMVDYNLNSNKYKLDEYTIDRTDLKSVKNISKSGNSKILEDKNENKKITFDSNINVDVGSYLFNWIKNSNTSNINVSEKQINTVDYTPKIESNLGITAERIDKVNNKSKITENKDQIDNYKQISKPDLNSSDSSTSKNSKIENPTRSTELGFVDLGSLQSIKVDDNSETYVKQISKPDLNSCNNLTSENSKMASPSRSRELGCVDLESLQSIKAEYDSETFKTDQIDTKSDKYQIQKDLKKYFSESKIVHLCSSIFQNIYSSKNSDSVTSNSRMLNEIDSKSEETLIFNKNIEIEPQVLENLSQQTQHRTSELDKAGGKLEQVQNVTQSNPIDSLISKTQDNMSNLKKNRKRSFIPRLCKWNKNKKLRDLQIFEKANETNLSKFNPLVNQQEVSAGRTISNSDHVVAFEKKAKKYNEMRSENNLKSKASGSKPKMKKEELQFLLDDEKNSKDFQEMLDFLLIANNPENYQLLKNIYEKIESGEKISDKKLVLIRKSSINSKLSLVDEYERPELEITVQDLHRLIECYYRVKSKTNISLESSTTSIRTTEHLKDCGLTNCPVSLLSNQR